MNCQMLTRRIRLPLRPAATWRALSSTSNAHIGLAELFGGVVNKPKEGTVVQVHEDAVARISGLRQARVQDLVNFRDQGTQGLVFDLEQSTVAVALMDKQIPEVGSDVDLTGQAPSVPVGSALLGRVIDPLGRPVAELDPQKGATLEQASLDGTLPTLSRIAPGIMARKPLCQRLGTGIKAVDVFHPLGHGQCLAVLGKKGSGKTSLALQTIMNQKSRNDAALDQAKGRVRCIYVAIGQERRALKRVIDTLTKAGCMDYVTVVAATADMKPGLRYMAPFTGCAIGEYWRDQGGRALVVFDDLSRHADAYSELAKFMPKPEVETGLALHGPLLERFAQLADEKGGGSMTGLVLVEGEANEGEEGGGLAHRIYSIADHSINLNLDLARKRIFPALDVTYQMNLQSPGSALLPEPTKAFVQNLRMMLAAALDDEAGAKMAEELGIHIADEAPEDKVEMLAYLSKLRRLYQQDAHEDVDDRALLLYLICSLRTVLQDLDLGAVGQLDAILSKELPKAKGWKKLSADLEGIPSQEARHLAEAFLTLQEQNPAHMPPPLALRSSSSSSLASSSAAQQQEGTISPEIAHVEILYNRLYEMLWRAIDYSKRKANAAKQEGGSNTAKRDEARAKISKLAAR